MRLGVVLPAGDELAVAADADAAGVAYVHFTAGPGAETALGAAVAARTSAVRIVVEIAVGAENPVTLAEELAVLDNLSNGRVVAVADTGGLEAAAAVEDVGLLLAALSGRPVQHQGPRWQVPAGLPGHTAPPAVMVTPKPAQLALPVWAAGDAAGDVAGAWSIPAVLRDPAAIDPRAHVAPGRAAIGGDLDADREVVTQWAQAGATHLSCELGGAASIGALARWLIPEVGMVAFPRVVADADLPARWPRDV